MFAPAASSSAPFAALFTRPAAAAAATLLLALSAAAVLVLCGEPTLAASAVVLPSVPSLPQAPRQRPGEDPMHAFFRELISGLHKALAERRRLAYLATLRDLDGRTLADIGISRSEIASIESEWRGSAELTRQRIIRVAGHA